MTDHDYPAPDLEALKGLREATQRERAKQWLHATRDTLNRITANKTNKATPPPTTLS